MALKSLEQPVHFILSMCQSCAKGKDNVHRSIASGVQHNRQRLASLRLLQSWWLQVTECLSGGNLKDVVHNLTVEMDLEMVLGILADVAVAMAYLHQLDPPISHQWLWSSKVLHPAGIVCICC